MEARANLKYARISPRKVKIVCDLIRGKDTKTAEAILMQTPKAASEHASCSTRSGKQKIITKWIPTTLCLETYISPGPILKEDQGTRPVYRINKRTSTSPSLWPRENREEACMGQKFILTMRVGVIKDWDSRWYCATIRWATL